MEFYEPMEYLDLSSNRLDSGCAEYIAKLVGRSKSLKELNLACNKLGQEAGERILEGLKSNDTLLKLDTRLRGRIELTCAISRCDFTGCAVAERASTCGYRRP